MPPETMIVDRVREEQKRMFRIALDPMRYGLTLKAIHADTGIGYESLRNYAAGVTTMPITAIHALCGVIPNELLSLMLPAGFGVVEQADDFDHATMAAKCVDYLTTYTAARDPNSEAGEALGPNERERLGGKVTGLRGAA